MAWTPLESREPVLQQQVLSCAAQVGLDGSSFYNTNELGLLQDDQLRQWLLNRAFPTGAATAGRDAATAAQSMPVAADPAPVAPELQASDPPPIAVQPAAASEPAAAPLAVSPPEPSRAEDFQAADPTATITAETPPPQRRMRESDYLQERSLRWIMVNGETPEDKAYAKRLYRRELFDLWRKHVAATGETYYPPLRSDLLEHYRLIVDEDRN